MPRKRGDGIVGAAALSDPMFMVNLALAINRPAFLYSTPGNGKSSMVEQLITRLGMGLYELSLITRDVSEISGLQSPDFEGKRTIRLAPDFFWFAKDNPNILIFFDDFTDAPRMCQAGCLKWVTERRDGEYQLPDQTRLMFAGNPANCNSTSMGLIPAMANRVIHIHFEPTVGMWLSGMRRGAWEDPEMIIPDFTGWRNSLPLAMKKVAAFIEAKPSMLTVFPENDEEAASGAWPSRRTVYYAAEILAALEAAGEVGIGQQLHALRCVVGKDWALEFENFARALDLLSPKEIVEDPLGCKMPERPDQLYFCLSALSQYVREEPVQKTWEAAWKFLDRAGEAAGMDVALPAALALSPLWFARGKDRKPLDPTPEVKKFMPLLSQIGARPGAVE